jgi:hypothetical protein
MLNKKPKVIRTLALTILTAALVGPSAWGQTFKVLHSFGNAGDGTAPIKGQAFDGPGTWLLDPPRLACQDVGERSRGSLCRRSTFRQKAPLRPGAIRSCCPR